MGTTDRVALPSIPPQVAVCFATIWSLSGLSWLWALIVDGPSVGRIAMPILFFLLVGGYFVLYRMKVVVTAEGVTHRPVFKTRLVPWSEIGKVDQFTRVRFRYIGFYTANTIVEAARPSEADYQRIMAMRKAHRSGGGRMGTQT